MAAALLVWACVGGDPTSPNTTANPGEEGGACFANGTCNPGLSCVDGICASGDGGASSGDASTDSGARDGSTSDSGGSGGCDGGPIPPHTGLISCDQDPNPPHKCATPGNECCNTVCQSNTPACAADGTPWQCQSKSDCSSGICCMDLLDSFPTTCPPSGRVISSLCQAGCDAGETQLCVDSTECGGGKCVAFAVSFQETSDAGITVGVCVP